MMIPRRLSALVDEEANGFVAAAGGIPRTGGAWEDDAVTSWG
jgi:hypothetical protein